jgi:hypothetical protein
VVKLAIGHRSDRTIVGFKIDRRLVGNRCSDMPIEAVVRSIELAICKPAVKRRIRLVQRLGKWLLPKQVLAR